MQIFARSIHLWGQKVISRSNLGSLIQHKHKGTDLAKIFISS